MADYTRELTELIQAFTKSGFTLLEVSSGADRVLLRRPASGAQPAAMPYVAVQPQAFSTQAPTPDAAPPSPQEPRRELQEPLEMRSALRSPRVGRFYQLQDAQGQPALKAGARLADGQVYGIIESMRLRYEIRSEKEGIVERVLVPSGESVEYGQPLILLQS